MSRGWGMLIFALGMLILPFALFQVFNPSPSAVPPAWIGWIMTAGLALLPVGLMWIIEVTQLD